MNATLQPQAARAPLAGTAPRPLMPMSAVMWRLDLDEERVNILIENGALLWAFDVASPSAERRALRVLVECVEDLALSRKRAYRDDGSEWQRVAGLILPDKPIMVTCEVARALNCGTWYTMMLIHAKQFRLVPGVRIRPGPKGSAQVVTASVKDWLLKRRVL